MFFPSKPFPACPGSSLFLCRFLSLFLLLSLLVLLSFSFESSLPSHLLRLRLRLRLDPPTSSQPTSISASTLTTNPSLPPTEPQSHPHIWAPATERFCSSGHFVSPLSSHGPLPSVLLRDVVVDRRYLTTKHISQDKVLLELYFTLHLSVRLNLENSRAYIQTHVQQYNVEVLSVTQTDDHLNNFPHAQYVPGKTTNAHGAVVTEWAVSISISPISSSPPMPEGSYPLQAVHRLHAAAKQRDLMLVLPLSFTYFDGNPVRFVPLLPLACATAWFSPDGNAFPLLGPFGNVRDEPSCNPKGEAMESDNQSTTTTTTTTTISTNGSGGGSALFSGTALYGTKNQNASYYSEIAHFAARALAGRHKFDYVFMSISAPISVSEAQHNCTNENPNSRTCVSNRLRTIEQHIATVRASVETELQVLGVERDLWSHLILVPACRLGSFHTGSEHSSDRGPCGMSRWYDQYMAALFAYAMIGSRFSWAVSYDMDEVLLSTNPKEKSMRMDSLLHSAMARGVVGQGYQDEGFVSFKWLDFRVEEGQVQKFTGDVMGSGDIAKRLALERNTKRGRRVAGVWEACLGWNVARNGKAALRCDSGVGFRIHQPVVIKNPDSVRSLGELAERRRFPFKAVKGIRAWHPRKKYSKRACVYVEDGGGRR